MTSIAIAHEWLDARAGSEKVFEAMAAALPSADLFALSRDPEVAFELGGRSVRTTMLQRGALRERRNLTLPLMPLAWRLLRAGKYDKVLTSSHACVKGFPPGRSAHHYCYVHAPMRYAWQPETDMRTEQAGPVTRGLLATMRAWDLRSTRWVDDFAANSTEVRDRIRRFYDRDAVVIAPPVDTDYFVPAPDGGAVPADAATPFAFTLSRFIPYKRIDLAIEAAHRAGVRLVVAGSGPEEGRLRALASTLGADVVFEIRPPDDRLLTLFRTASAFVFVAEEDFGIVPVEAQACGTPVVALGKGGALDTVVDGETGVLVPEQDVEAFAEGIEKVMGMDEAVRRACRANAIRFGPERFRRELLAFVEEPGGG